MRGDKNSENCRVDCNESQSLHVQRVVVVELPVESTLCPVDDQLGYRPLAVHLLPV